MWLQMDDLRTVYNTPPKTKDNMKERIGEAFRNITPKMLPNVAECFQKKNGYV